MHPMQVKIKEKFPIFHLPGIVKIVTIVYSRMIEFNRCLKNIHINDWKHEKTVQLNALFCIQFRSGSMRLFFISIPSCAMRASKALVRFINGRFAEHGVCFANNVEKWVQSCLPRVTDGVRLTFESGECTVSFGVPIHPGKDFFKSTFMESYQCNKYYSRKEFSRIQIFHQTAF